MKRQSSWTRWIAPTAQACAVAVLLAPAPAAAGQTLAAAPEATTASPSRAATATQAAAAAATATADARSAVLAGRVVDATQGALPGATLDLRPESRGTPASGAARTIVADAEGAFRISGLQPGSYRLTVRMPGFADHTQTVTLAAAQVADLAITLSPSGGTENVDVVATARDVSATGTKTDTPLIETPQAISVITAERLQAQAPLTVQDALRYSAGVRAESFGFDARGDWSVIRGGSPSMYVNGLRLLFGSYNIGRPDTFAIERIDVMRGPSSVLYGQGGFAGVVNIVSKRPLATARREVTMQFGNYARKQLGLDLTGPLDKDGHWLYRLVVLGRDSDTQVDHVPDNRLLIAPALTWRPRASTSLTLLTNFQRDESGSSVMFFPWDGTLLPHAQGQIPTSAFIGEPGFDAYDTRQAAAGYQFEHQLTRRWTVRQNFNYSRNRVTYQSIYANFRNGFHADGVTLDRVLYVRNPKTTVPVVDTNVQGKLTTGGLQHTVLAGVDYQHATITGVTASGTAPAMNVFAPVYGNFTPPATLNPLPKNVQEQAGVYAQDQIKVAQRWVALVGGRRDWVNQQTQGSAAKVDIAATTGRAGLVYLSSLGLAPYVSYTQSFDPITGLDFYNNPYKPRRGKQVEAGAKFEPKNKSGLVSLALFDLREQNRLTPDPANAQNSIQVGEARIRGVELEAGAKLVTGIDLLANYSYTEAKVTKSNSTDLGKRLSSTPAHLLSVWATRTFDIGPVRGLTAGGGARYTGASWDGADRLKTPDVTLYDLMFSYALQDWRVAVNVANLTDKTFLSTCLARGDCFFGMRRTVSATLSRKF